MPNQRKFYTKPCSYEPRHSASVFEMGRVNQFGEPFCLHSGLSIRQAEECVQSLNATGFDPISQTQIATVKN